MLLCKDMLGLAHDQPVTQGRQAQMSLLLTMLS